MTVLTRPDLVQQTLWQPAQVNYLIDLLVPFAWLPLIGLPIVAIGLPSFAINLLSAHSPMHDATVGHYTADLILWLAWGTLFGLWNLKRLAALLWSAHQQRFTHLLCVRHKPISIPI